jgi:sterol desaturase/sphingolipid hydroxylase (fatty acid hydroxylase superfamily)
MPAALLPPDHLAHVRPVLGVVLLALLWVWESCRPVFERGEGRLRHAAHNLALALLNAFLLGLLFAAATVFVAGWAQENRLGLLHQFDGAAGVRLVLAVILLDAWMYVWHRANHYIPSLWRFHRMHHSDDRLDVTTATRFHPGELVLSSLLRLGLIPLVGFEFVHLLVYDTLQLVVTQLHHANIGLGRWDRPLRWLLVTPSMHKVHHSRLRAETDSNYSSVLSLWDRLAGTFRTRTDPSTISFGLAEFDDPHWQTLPGLLATPLAPPQGPRSVSPNPRPMDHAIAR